VASSIQPKNFSALKPGVQNTCEPAASGASTPAMRPWMWNSGMMFRPQSAAVNCSVRRMLVAEAPGSLRQRHDLGPRGGARGVQHHGHVVGLGISRRWRRRVPPAPAPCSVKLPRRRVSGTSSIMAHAQLARHGDGR
jgi:hypothetical protein